jgi:hypothetical protein
MRPRVSEPSGTRSWAPAAVAQLAEQRTFNPKVVGSIPTGGIKKWLQGWRVCGIGVWDLGGECPPICPEHWPDNPLVSNPNPPRLDTRSMDK